MTYVIFNFHFGLFLVSLLALPPLLPPLSSNNLKEMKKDTLRYHHLTHVYQKL